MNHPHKNAKRAMEKWAGSSFNENNPMTAWSKKHRLLLNEMAIACGFRNINHLNTEMRRAFDEGTFKEFVKKLAENAK